MSKKNQTEQPEVTETIDEMTELDNLKEPELAGGETDYDPAADEAADKALAEQNQQLQAQAMATAMVVVTVIESTVSMMCPGVEIDSAQKQAVVQKMLPVLVKYQSLGLPPWLVKYKEEMELIGAVGMVGFSVYQQVKAQKAKDITPEGGNGEESQPEAA